jgi:hypothetical protein
MRFSRREGAQEPEPVSASAVACEDYIRVLFACAIWCRLPRGIDLRRHVRIDVDHRLAQARNADSLRATGRPDADSEELAADLAACAVAIAFICVLGPSVRWAT